MDTPAGTGLRSRIVWQMGAQNPSQPEEPHHESGAGHSTPRIPGQRDRTAAPDNAPDDVDLGWVLHEGGGSGSFDGWLYHYADGTMVDAQGVEYRITDQTAEDASGGESEPVDPPADAAVAGLTSGEGSETQPEREPETERPRLRAVEDHETAGESEDADAPVADEPGDEPATERAGPSADEDADEDADRQDGGEETAGTLAGEPADEASERENSRDQSVAPAEADDADEPDPAPASGPAPASPRTGDVPAFVEYTPGPLRGYLLGAVFVVAAVAGVLTSFVAISEQSTAALVVAAGCFALGLVAWWALLSWRPVVVTVREGTLEITRGEHGDTFDLTDPATVVEFRGRPGPTWTALVRHGNGPRTVLRSSHVKPRQFERIVRHHRASDRPRDDAAV